MFNENSLWVEERKREREREHRTAAAFLFFYIYSSIAGIPDNYRYKQTIVEMHWDIFRFATWNNSQQCTYYKANAHQYRKPFLMFQKSFSPFLTGVSIQGWRLKRTQQDKKHLLCGVPEGWMCCGTSEAPFESKLTGLWRRPTAHIRVSNNINRIWTPE